jgi:hypothetical protein
MEKMNIKEILTIISILSLGFVLSFFTISKIGIWDHDAAILISFNRLLIYKKIIRDDFFIKGFYTPPLPFFILFGLTGFALRFSQAIFLTVTIFLTYLFTKEFFSKRTAVITSLMLSTFPFYILSDGGETPFLPFFTIGFLLFLQRFLRNGKSKNLYFSLLLIGYAITVKLSFIYLFISVIITSFLANYTFKGKIMINNILKKNQIVKGLIFLSIGASPLILANILYNFPTLRHIKENFITTSSGWQNFNILKSLNIHWNYFQLLFRIPTFGIWTSSNGYLDIMRYIFSFVLFLISFFYLLFTKKQRDCFIILVSILFSLLIMFVPTAPHPEHFFPIIPLFLIIIGRFLTTINSKWTYILVSLFLFLNLLTILKVNQLLDNEEELENVLPHYAKFHSFVAKYVENASTIVTPFTWQAEYLSNLFPQRNIITLPFEDVCEPGYCYHKAKPKEIKTEFERILDEQNVLYIFPSQSRNTSKDRRVYLHSCINELINDSERNLCDVSFKIFKNTSIERNKTINLEGIINDSVGRPVYEIYSIII